MLRISLAGILVVTSVASSSVPWPQSPSSDSPGIVIPRVTSLSNTQQSYALYLPSKYSRERRWPIVYIFDPLARGELALSQFQQAAEVRGFIVVASNTSRNGPGAAQVEAAQAMASDTQQRFSVDTQRVYFAGFSGGARVASRLALVCKCAAGVLLSGAGFPQNSRPSQDVKFAVFSGIGSTDFNYSEVIALEEQLERSGVSHWLGTFEGPHEWAPPRVIDEALAWFRVQAMKSRLESRDDAFIAAQFAGTIDRAASLEKSGDLLSAWREYRQAAATFDSLVDVTAVRSKAQALAKDKSVRDALKRERNAFDEQSRLSAEVLSAVSPSNDSPASSRPASPAQSASQLARDLRQRSLAEKRPDRAVIFKRALGGVFIASIESGNAALEKKEYSLAAQYFACAAEANPESELVFRQLAVARALSGDKTGTMEALRSARKLTSDPSDFVTWLNQETAFDRLRSAADFQSLVAKP